MDPFRTSFFPNNSSSSVGNRYAPIPPPRFPDDDRNRHPILHPSHPHRLFRPAYNNHHHHNHPFMPSSPYPSSPPPFNPNLLPHRPTNPTALNFPPPHPSRVSVHDRIQSDRPLPPLAIWDDSIRLFEPARSPPPSVWDDVSRRPAGIERDAHPLNHRGVPFPLAEAVNSYPAIPRRFNTVPEGIKFVGRSQDFDPDDHLPVDNSWEWRDHPHHHHRDHDYPRQVRRKSFPSESFTSNSFESTSSIGSAERAVRNKKLLSKLAKGKKALIREYKPQKTSPFLRIQAGSKMIRKKKDDQLIPFSYFADSTAAAPKDKGPVVFTGHSQENGSSSVELDVSFKSNALVAKAIFVPNDPLDGCDKTVPTMNKKKKRIKKSVSITSTKKLAGVDSKDVSNSHNQIEVTEKARNSDAGAAVGAGSRPCQSDVTVLVGKDAFEGSSDMVVSLGDNSWKDHVECKEDITNNVESNVGFTSLGSELAALETKSQSSGLDGDPENATPARTVTDCGQRSVEVDVTEGAVETQEQTEVGVMEEHGTTSSDKCQDTVELRPEVREKLEILPSEVQTSVLGQASPSRVKEGVIFGPEVRKELSIFPLDVLTSVLDQVSPFGVMECDNSHPMDTEGLHHSDDALPEAEAMAVSTNNSMEEGIMHSPDVFSRVDSPESFSVVPRTDHSNADQSFCQLSDENVSTCISKQDDKTTDNVGFSSNETGSSALECKVSVKSDQMTTINNHVNPEKKQALQFMVTKRPSTDHKSTAKVLISNRSSYRNSGTSNSLPPRAAFASGSVKEMISSTRSVRPRTWHRTDSSFTSPAPVRELDLSTGPSARQSPKKIGKPQNPSYIRKGNSLVRKSNPVAALSGTSPALGASLCQPNSTSEDKMMKMTMASERIVGSTDCSKSTSLNPSFERPKTPPLPNTTKLLSSMTKNFRDSTNPTEENPTAQVGLESTTYITSDPVKHVAGRDVVGHDRASENHATDSLASKLGIQSTSNDGKLNSPKAKRLIYVKRKSYQLVAAPRPEICNSTAPITGKTQAVYYKRRKNQLVRNITSSKSQIKQAATMPDDGSNSEGQSATEVSSSKLSKRTLDKVLEKCKRSKFSLVWTLGGTESSNKGSTFLQHRKVLPCLFPWKRTMYRRRFMSSEASVSNKNSLSLISRKLQLSRQRDTMYTRSTSGFSLRKSRVLSIGGSNLKWSKSIERRSKKANEEATLAVAAAERKKREQKQVACIAKDKDRNCSSRKSTHGIELQPGERVFRVGSVRYKMDSSNRTLSRIPDEKSSATDLESEKDGRISFVPRRLLIGNDEYIRIGNGNQLIRDPKKLTRILASEKIRWSLHTARLRLAKRQQYCQFFTRFGKCNKDDGKCPYIHDPAKIVVCTKFLKGQCSSSNCKLTHKVIPERMPDCSYFLQGLCTNETCPYRHVNVNPNASVCEGFLKGYCADGYECRRKHTYVCPVFESNGICPQGSACKLHHPKTANKNRKRKRTKDERNIKGRYFGSPGLINIGESKEVDSDNHTTKQSGDIFVCDGRYTDYISLDFVVEEASETKDLTDTNEALSNGEPLDLGES